MDEPVGADTLPEGEWAIVELMGHQELVGRIAEVERFGAKMLAIEPLFNGHLLPVLFHGGPSIYRLTPCTPVVAWARQPTSAYQFPPSIRATLPPAALPPGQLPLDLDAREVDLGDGPEPQWRDRESEDEEYR